MNDIRKLIIDPTSGIWLHHITEWVGDYCSQERLYQWYYNDLTDNNWAHEFTYQGPASWMGWH